MDSVSCLWDVQNRKMCFPALISQQQSEESVSSVDLLAGSLQLRLLVILQIEGNARCCRSEMVRSEMKASISNTRGLVHDALEGWDVTHVPALVSGDGSQLVQETLGLIEHEQIIGCPQ